MTPRRGRGEGSFRQRKDGLWEARFYFNGKRYSLYAATKGELLEKVARVKGEIVLGYRIDPVSITVDEYLDAWLATKDLRAESAKVYKRSVVLAKQHLGNIRLGELAPLQVQFFYRQAGAAQSVLVQVDQVLRSAFNAAVKSNYIRTSPMQAVNRPKKAKRDYRILDSVEVQRFIQAALKDHYGALMILALTTGAREGELFALTWSDIDLLKAKLTINKSVSEVVKPEVGAPKTEQSKRVVDLPSIAVEALKRHKKAQKARGVLVFPNAKGGYLRRSNFLRRHFKTVLRAARLPADRIRFHDLRHTVASHLLESNMNPDRVSKLLGHANVSTTTTVYGHLLPGAGKEVAEKVDSLFGGALGVVK